MMEVCEVCVIGKAKKFALNEGEQLFAYISSVALGSFSGSKFWIAFLDDCTEFCWSYFVNKKEKLWNVGLQLLQQLKAWKRAPREVTFI